MGYPASCSAMEVILGTNIGLRRGIIYMLLGLYVLAGSDVGSSLD